MTQAMFRGGFAGCKTREEFVEEIADVYISKVRVAMTTIPRICYKRRHCLNFQNCENCELKYILICYVLYGILL